MKYRLFFILSLWISYFFAVAQEKTMPSWILRDSLNQPLCTLACQNILPLSAEVVAYQTSKGWGTMQPPNCFLLPPQFDTIFAPQQELAYYKKNEKWGVLHLSGWILLPPIFDTVIIGQSHIAAKKQTQWQIHDNYTGKIIAQNLDSLIVSKHHWWPVKPEGGCWGYLDLSTGTYPLGIQYDVAQPMVQKTAVVKIEGIWGLLTTEKTWQLGAVFDELTRLTDSTFLAKAAGFQAILDQYGNPMLETKDSLLLRRDGFILHKKGVKTGLWDKNGCVIVPAEADYDHISELLLPDSIFVLEQDICKGVAHVNAGISCEPRPKFKSISASHEGLAIAKIGKRYGYIDKTGYVRVANRYDTVQAFSEGFAAVKIKKRWAYINRKEEIVVQPLYEQAKPVVNGLAIVQKNKRYGVVNMQGQEIHPMELDSLWVLPSGYFISLHRQQKGVLNPKGQVVFYPKYDKITQLNNDYFLVERDAKKGIYQPNAEPFIPMLFKEIIYNSAAKNYWLLPIH